MAYHPAIGDIRSQLPRVALIAAMLAAAATLLALGTEGPSLPPDRWYRLSGRHVMQADIAFRFGLWLEQLGYRLPSYVQRHARLTTEQAISVYERQALTDVPNPGAVYRLGVIYGHRGYHRQAEHYLTWAVALDEAKSDLYYALAQVYSDEPGAPADDLEAQEAVLAGQVGWLADITLRDYHERLGNPEQVEDIERRQAQRTRLFGLSLCVLGIALAALMLLGLTLLVISAMRYGFSLVPPRREPQLPFLVPWTFIDVAEIVALLPFALVVVGVSAASLWAQASAQWTWPLARPLLVTAQYLGVAALCLIVIFKRVRARSSAPSRSLGLRAARPLRLIGAGIAGYAVFIALISLLAVVLRGMLGEVLPLASSVEELIGSPHSTGELIIYAVLVCVIAPIVEEIIFRGYVYAGIRRFLRPPQAMLLGGLIFWVVHFNPTALLVITLIGIMLCYLYERTRSLLPGMVAHGLHNAIVLVALVVHSI